MLPCVSVYLSQLPKKKTHRKRYSWFFHLGLLYLYPSFIPFLTHSFNQHHLLERPAL